jgi:hypothetical protein
MAVATPVGIGTLLGVAMNLPEADGKTKAGFIALLEGFSVHAVAVDYASARPLLHREILAFGTRTDSAPWGSLDRPRRETLVSING